MGNGEYSMAQVGKHMLRLAERFTELSGIQQLGCGPDADGNAQQEALYEFECETKRWLRQLENDLIGDGK
jgi:hypothetical protein